MAEQFEEVQVCPFCGAETEERGLGDEGWTFCSDDCGCLEGEKPVHKFACVKCGNICDEEKCDCQNKIENGKL